MNALEHFQQIFPSNRLIAYDGELRYRFRTEQIGKIYERIAQKVIMKNALRATAALEVWQAGEKVTEIAMVVKATPEESDFADEVPDTEGLDGGWWNKDEE